MERDIFISYNTKDRIAVDRVVQELKSGNLNIAYDRWYLPVGKPWRQVLEDQLSVSRNVAVFVGPAGIGPWQQREISAALDRQTKDPNFRVIPVLLSGCDPPTGFLSLNTWIDLRNDDEVASGIARLIASIKDEPTPHGSARRLPSERPNICPFRGLRAFREEDAPFFFGRDTASNTLLEYVSSKQLIVLVGPSGSGKSSVARAGLIPRLRSSATVWEIATLRPGNEPFTALSETLLPLLDPVFYNDPETTETRRLAEIGELAEKLRSRTIRLTSVITTILRDKQPGTERLFILVDQAEELVTSTRNEEAAQFVEELLNASEFAPITILFTLRGDFYHHLLQHRVLADRLSGGIINLGPMTREELNECIEEPANKVDLKFESGLIEDMLDEVESTPESLPLLQLALTELWQGRQKETLLHQTLQDKESGLRGVRTVIARQAKKAWKTLSDEEKKIAPTLFLRLVKVTADTTTRRRIDRSVLSPLETTLARTLAREENRILATDRQGKREIVELAHEALLSAWPWLQEQVASERDFLLWRSRLQTALAEWEHHGRPWSLLLRAGQLSEVNRYLRTHGHFLVGDEETFVKFSRRRKGLLRLALGGAPALILVLTALYLLELYADSVAGSRRFEDISIWHNLRYDPALSESSSQSLECDSSLDDWIDRFSTLRLDEHSAWLSNLQLRPEEERTKSEIDQARSFSQMIAFRWLTTRWKTKKTISFSELPPWREVISAIKKSPEYAGLEIKEATDLLPIGKNLLTGYFEFLHCPSHDQKNKSLSMDSNRNVFLEETTGVVLILLPAARTRIGANRSQDSLHYDPAADPDELPVHEVELAPFYISKYELTEAQWQRITGGQSKGDTDRELTSLLLPALMSWEEASQTLPLVDLCLPTEAQWEHSRSGRSANDLVDWESRSDPSRSRDHWTDPATGR